MLALDIVFSLEVNAFPHVVVGIVTGSAVRAFVIRWQFVFTHLVRPSFGEKRDGAHAVAVFVRRVHAARTHRIASFLQAAFVCAEGKRRAATDTSVFAFPKSTENAS